MRIKRSATSLLPRFPLALAPSRWLTSNAAARTRAWPWTWKAPRPRWRPCRFYRESSASRQYLRTRRRIAEILVIAERPHHLFVARDFNYLRLFRSRVAVADDDV